MNTFISSFIGAMVGALTWYFMIKVFHRNNEINMSNKEEILKELDAIDRQYAQEKMNDVLEKIEFLETHMDEFKNYDANKLMRIMKYLDRYIVLLFNNEIINKQIEKAVIDKTTARIRDLLDTLNQFYNSLNKRNSN